jgi:hypothetical protein
MGYTKRKIRGINFSFLLAGFIFACWALVCAWEGWPRGFRHGSAAGFTLFALAALFFAAFPVLWTRFPKKHPVNHELARYGKIRKVSELLDREMAEHFENFGPFRFTKSLLIYDSGLEFQMVPYDQIASAEIEQAASDEPVALVIRTRKGRQYQWYRTFMQGRFDPQKTLERIRAAARLEDQQPKASEENAV